MTINDLANTEHDPYYGRYIRKLSDDLRLRDGFKIGGDKVRQFFKNLPDEMLGYRYQPEKWCVKEVFQHLIDTERVFMYRCFRIARGDKTALAGFNQNIFVEPSKAMEKSRDQLIGEFIATRAASISLLDSLTNADLLQIGDANGGAMSARAAAFTIIGHDIWHMDVIRNLYLEER
ncbi:MAG: DinB family protein [Calditrichota bacterium]